MEQKLINNHHHPATTGGPRSIIFDKYEMGRLLGKGTFAKVYHARNLETSESVAIKVISKDQIKKQKGIADQIQREIAVMRLVRHPNIVEIKEVLATKLKIFVVMEHVRGGELFEKVARGKLREEVARKYFQQLISAVDFCHSRGVYHRDLKPENLLLDEDGNLKVTDFGLSALPEQLRHDGMLHTQCGTPAYVAPEVLRKKGYDGARADIWSCGVILYVLLAGFLPFQNENVMKMYTKIFKAEYEFPPWFSYEAKRLISRVLVADPCKRITIQGITKVSWFRKGGFSNNSRPVAVFPIEGQGQCCNKDDHKNKNDHRSQESVDDDEDQLMRSKSAPPFFNAFEFISSMSSGFDLSSLFESRTKSGSLFTSRFSASSIVGRLEGFAKKLNFRVVFSKDYKVKMQGVAEGRKGKLLVTADIYEVAPEVSVVEFSKSSGDTLEYKKFCDEDVRTGLRDIVWTWQGEECSSNNISND